MKIIYLILVVIILSCTATETKTKPQEIEILSTDIDVKPSGNSVVVTRYSDSTKSVVNLNKYGELIDSTFFYNQINK